MAQQVGIDGLSWLLLNTKMSSAYNDRWWCQTAIGYNKIKTLRLKNRSNAVRITNGIRIILYLNVAG